MDTVSEKIESLLSDPESMKNLAELAAMLREPDSGGTSAGQKEPDPPEPDAAPPFDMGKLLAAMQALSTAQQDENAALILALKPHLSAERAKRAEKAARLLRLWHAAEMLRETGMLSEIL